MLTIVEKVLLLQEVDIFKNTSTEDLAHIASITDEITFSAENEIFKEADISDSMYIVVEGLVRLHRADREVMKAETKDAFGTWALFDDESRVTSATTVKETTLLRIDREEFYDLLADHSRITQGIFKTLSRRLKGLFNRVKMN
jgi:CRP-like cAMP-binding protein